MGAALLLQKGSIGVYPWLTAHGIVTEMYNMGEKGRLVFPQALSEVESSEFGGGPRSLCSDRLSANSVSGTVFGRLAHGNKSSSDGCKSIGGFKKMNIIARRTRV